ncbi:conserved Plasmodium protein, unknown function [Plasmodium knowlesi strain H]|uniref:Ubiquitin-like domain-containing protein n=3 Tax=Plasmodium knowlesi TaxID=5850 RepID=A0A5K1UT27_PLAKH|nr:conserved Plasmodium protein, unknown function [Plasmodium knowlesi strain H]OTN64930.1 Uncharacterized protein PKNOH_S120142100 [Plasmodium knowlesi]CAA9988278.1 conserved Plasmodium protein, unknown function [Plasmodium knowlesi strain H]SBO20217.1 conserved Plasmodium protein, unknown function [Plasmodium knowlesi strain H]SBO20384.1 conserved Plasmodium protein, unknown function [Plasmodium knowlesi strain H]VVS77752.1 conserved Plasmodium protein, unknown function [Plasmodium knowlesi |eukprot:XP_002259255.1 hypothetical protein, conserved in Plasmodium species [Plasmodium knowlesi strain H]
MVTKLIKFIVLRPRGIPENLELEVNCSEVIKNVKEKLFLEDLKKELNVRFIYMGKMLDDKKRLEDYLSYYYKDLTFNGKHNSSGHESRKDGPGGASGMSRDTNVKNGVNSSKDNFHNIPITIHVKITEKSTSSGSDHLDGKNMNTTLAQLSLIMFVSLLWMYRYNYAEAFPLFSSIVLCIFTVMIVSLLFYTYIIMFFQILLKVMVITYNLVKQSTVRVLIFINERKAKLFVRRETMGGGAAVKEN